MVEVELYKHLLSIDEITALIGDRFFPLKADENCKIPFMVYTVVNDRDRDCLDGETYDKEVFFQIDCYSRSYGEVKILKEKIKGALKTFKYIPLDFRSRDLYEKDTKLNRQIIEFKIKEK